jgi:hypothetical protein
MQSEYQRILLYRGPGFRPDFWLASRQPPPPSPVQQLVSLAQSSPVLPVELTYGRGGERVGEEPNPTTARIAQNIQYSLVSTWILYQNQYMNKQHYTGAYVSYWMFYTHHVGVTSVVVHVLYTSWMRKNETRPIRHIGCCTLYSDVYSYIGFVTVFR